LPLRDRLLLIALSALGNSDSHKPRRDNPYRCGGDLYRKTKYRHISDQVGKTHYHLSDAFGDIGAAATWILLYIMVDRGILYGFVRDRLH
jgi:hypothetical protein